VGCSLLIGRVQSSCQVASVTALGIPTAVAIIGSDDAIGEFSILYVDDRGVSRRYEVTMNGNVMELWVNRR
jgi:hypothetical protein